VKALLLFPDRESDWRWVGKAAAKIEAQRTGRIAHGLDDFDPSGAYPWHSDALRHDLALDALIDAAAGEADDVRAAFTRELLNAPDNDAATIRHRQAILADALKDPKPLREIHAIAEAAVAEQHRHFLGTMMRDYPDAVLRWAIEMLEAMLDPLRRLHRLSAREIDRVEAPGWRRFHAMIRDELGDDYLAGIETRLRELKLRDGVLMSAALGPGNRGVDYRLHQPPIDDESRWHRWLRQVLPWLFRRPESERFSFSLAPSDESGQRALRGISNRGVSIAAQALGEAALHIRDFFAMLRAESAFYVGAVALHEVLAAKSVATAFPDIVEEPNAFHAEGLREPALALTIGAKAVPNDVDADGRDLIVVTGANQGGKSTLLRAIGAAQMMAGCGLPVAADALRLSLSPAVMTHFKREEDAAMKSGKFDEELARMSAIVEHMAPGALVLLNESFASTSEREAAEIADEVIEGLRAGGARVVFVTHLFEYADRAANRDDARALFLRAQRAEDGTRPFNVTPGAPRATSFGEDLYAKVFGDPFGKENPH
jgi:hypothetical protein